MSTSKTVQLAKAKDTFSVSFALVAVLRIFASAVLLFYRDLANHNGLCALAVGRVQGKITVCNHRCVFACYRKTGITAGIFIVFRVHVIVRYFDDVADFGPLLCVLPASATGGGRNTSSLFTITHCFQKSSI